MRILILLLFISTINAQQKMIVPEYEPGQLIVKLKDDISAGITYGDNNNTKSGIARNEINKDIGKILGISQKIKKQEVLFSLKSIERSLVVRNENIRKQDELNNKPKTQGVQGSDPSEDQQFFSMKNVIKIEFEDPMINIYEIIEQLKDNPKVDYVEPNYIFSINDYTIESDIIYDKDLKTLNNSNTTTTTPSDPLYSEQSGIIKTNIDDVWNEYGTGNGSQIVAVLDTGVDYTHPDLEDNIWVNEAELNGVEGFDDDGNGYVDDIRGWDFINNDNAPLDDNMHGTHVAGIIGAVGNNDKGIAGAAWNVKIMPVKVFQSNGSATSVNIALGVDYARIAGATIQNYSFGGYAESFTAKTAYENAYANNAALLVAASGNDSKSIGPCLGCRPMYPAAYTYILGIEDGEKGYDNFDQDGPLFSGYSDYLNYELKAVGFGVMSTVPDGGYRKLTGTSMAAPLVAGAMALYLENKPDDSKEIIFGNLINTSSGLVDFEKALDVTPTPILKILGAELKDENEDNDNEYFQPGKTVRFFPIIKNYWGPTDDVRVGIEFAEFEDQTKADIIESEISIGSMSAYSNLKINDKSLKVKLSDNLSNKVVIKFKLSVWSGDNKEYLTSKEIEIESTNAIILEDYITTDMTLKKDNLYVFEGNMILTNGITLTIEPGVIIRMGDQRKIYIDGNSKLLANGTKDKPITIEPDPNVNAWAGVVVNSGSATFNYTHFKNLFKQLYDKPIFTGGIYNNCLFYDMNVTGAEFSQSATFNYSNFIESFFRWGTLDGTHNYSTMSNMNYMHEHGYSYSDGPAKRSYNYNSSHVINYLCDNSKDHQTIEHPLLRSSGNLVGVLPLPENVYFGSSSLEKLKEFFTDYKNDDNLTAKFNYDDLRLTPYEEPHGIVWKVLVNGKDAQDEYDEMDPIGVGNHEFKVYFNREMDTSVAPQISYGVRIPYNQKLITEQGTWSLDGKIYTVTHDLNIGAADGINRIRVQDAKDLDNFMIPVEDSRFNILVQSAGSASTGFAATPGLGEVSLEWTSPNESDLSDILGYNMYRYEAITDTTYTDTLKINKVLITDINYKDYDVVRNKKYFYTYKILRTSFDETDYSKTVTAELLTADLGDSNGDSSVNVLDVVNCVDYILGNNPGPFIDYATDVNNDSSINVLDVVGIVDLVLNDTGSANPTGGGFKTSSSNPIEYYSNVPIGKAEFYWEGNDLYVESKFDIGGMQLTFDKNFKYQLSEEVSKFEHLNFDQDNKKVFMIYSFNSTSAKKKTKLLTRLDPDAGFDIGDAVVGTTNGLKLQASYKELILPDLEAPEQGDELKLLSISPSPSNGKIKVRYYVPQKMDRMVVRLYNTLGQLIWSGEDLNNNAGYSEESINLNPISKGIYIFTMDAFKSGEIKDRTFKRLIIE